MLGPAVTWSWWRYLFLWVSETTLWVTCPCPLAFLGSRPGSWVGVVKHQPVFKAGLLKRDRSAQHFSLGLMCVGVVGHYFITALCTLEV